MDCAIIWGFPGLCYDKPSRVSQDCAMIRHPGFPTFDILMLYKGTKICYDKTGLMLAQCYSCATGLARVTLCLNNSWHSIADRLLMSKPETGHRRGQGVLVRGEGEVTQSKMADRSGNLPSPLTSTSRPLLTTIVCSGVDQRKHQSSASLAFVRGIHRWQMNFRHTGLVTRRMFPFDDVIMW